MKQKKLAPFLAVTMSLELVLSPVVAVAKEKEGVTANDVFSTVLGVASTIYEDIRQKSFIPSPQMAGDMDAFKRQQTPLPDKYFNPQKLSQIPGLGQYLAMNGINPNSLSCVTLPTNLHEAHNEVCRVGVTGDKGHPAQQVQEAFMYMQQYTAIDKMYRNFSSESNVGGELFGVGCMKNAMQVLNGFFKYRLDELDKLVTNIEAIQAGFKEASKADLNAIEESTAVLTGGGSELTNRVKSKRPDLFDYAKRFNNPACASMLSKDEFNKNGGKSGLAGISDLLQTTVNSKVGPMGFSGESYAKGHSDVVADISSLAEKVGKQMELNFDSLSESSKGYSEVIKGLGGLSSANKLNGALSPDLFGDVQTKFAEKNDKLKSTLTEIGSELGGAGGNALNLVRNNNSGAFEAEVKSVELRLKNGCLKSQARVDEVLDRMVDPSSSKFANKNASNFTKTKLKEIMENEKTSFETKIAQLKQLEAKEGARYELAMDSAYEVNESDASGKVTTTKRKASQRLTPSVYFSDVIKNCQTQFEVNQLGNKLSGAQAIKKLRQLHQDYRSLAKTHAQEVKTEIRKKLIECESPSKANATVTGSCTPQAFDTSAPGFCAKNAFTCSKNMQACSKQAEKFVEDIKKERTARVNNYKNMVEKNKQDIVKIFDTALSRYMKDGELLRGAFGAGFSSPSGIQRDVPEGQRYLPLFQQATNGSPDGALLLEDPDKFVGMFKENINLLKKSVEDQQNQILGGGLGNNNGLLAQHMKDTAEKYKKISSEAKQFAQNCQQQHDKYITEMEAQRKQMAAEQAKKQAELGEKSREFCRKYSMAQENPGPACGGNVQDLTSAVAAMPNGADAANEFERVCDSYNNEGNSGNMVQQAYRICTNHGHKPKTEDAAVSSERAKLQKALKDAEWAYKQAELAVKKAKVNGTDEQIKEAEGALVDAEEKKMQAEHDLASYSPPAGKAASSGAKQKAKDQTLDQAMASSGGAGNVGANCAQLMKCKEKGTAIMEGGKVVGHESNCPDDDHKAALAQEIVESQGARVHVEEDMPAFCTAGNGSMGPPKNFFESMKQGFDRGFAGSGAVGQ